MVCEPLYMVKDSRFTVSGLWLMVHGKSFNVQCLLFKGMVNCSLFI